MKIAAIILLLLFTSFKIDHSVRENLNVNSWKLYLNNNLIAKGFSAENKPVKLNLHKFYMHDNFYLHYYLCGGFGVKYEARLVLKTPHLRRHEGQVYPSEDFIKAVISGAEIHDVAKRGIRQFSLYCQIKDSTNKWEEPFFITDIECDFTSKMNIPSKKK